MIKSRFFWLILIYIVLGLYSISNAAEGTFIGFLVQNVEQHRCKTSYLRPNIFIRKMLKDKGSLEFKGTEDPFKYAFTSTLNPVRLWSLELIPEKQIYKDLDSRQTRSLKNYLEAWSASLDTGNEFQLAFIRLAPHSAKITSDVLSEILNAARAHAPVKNQVSGYREVLDVIKRQAENLDVKIELRPLPNPNKAVLVEYHEKGVPGFEKLATFSIGSWGDLMSNREVQLEVSPEEIKREVLDVARTNIEKEPSLTMPFGEPLGEDEEFIVLDARRSGLAIFLKPPGTIVENVAITGGLSAWIAERSRNLIYEEPKVTLSLKVPIYLYIQ